nr:MAG TPA: hypothetical protein [Caudoviricetes sp.]DAM02519.1 MAG TPA: hypothetical protein [Caudoviricetes sp.]
MACKRVHNHIIKPLVVIVNPYSFPSFSGKIR